MAIVNAPEINTKYGWLNTGRAYSIKDFRGKIVLLDFWTYGCINCQHIIPDLERLEKEFAEELVIIGVHSGKFNTEKSGENIRSAIFKFGIKHPVVNDADFKVWSDYAVKAWPTLVLISPNGKVVAHRSGEGFYGFIKEHIQKLIIHYDKDIDRCIIDFSVEEEEKTFLRFPSKIISDEENNIWLSDSGNNRILKINREGKILEIIGSGKSGENDGEFSDAELLEPHGLALHYNKLYIADTKNNKIKVADLEDKTLITIVGDGKLHYYFDKYWESEVNPNSPWDLLIYKDVLYIANAGSHQVLQMDVSTNKVTRLAGSGREALHDGSYIGASFNQPSGLTLWNNKLIVADAEASAIRAIDFDKKEVRTLVGAGLFTFGDEDGLFDAALLQHAMGVTAKENNIYVADTYNGKVRVLDMEKKIVSTIVEGLNEPNDVLIIGDTLFITDTNNHRLVKVNLADNQKTVIEVKISY